MILELIACLIMPPKGAECSRCKYVKYSNYYPPYSQQFEDCLSYTEKRVKLFVPENDRQYMKKLLNKENVKGDVRLKNKNSTAYGLGQGLRSTYKNVGVPYGNHCPSCQLEMVLKYRYRRYSSFSHAWRFWNGRGPKGKTRRYY